MKDLIFPAILILLFSSCEKTIQLDLDQAPQKIVVQGLITDELKQHTISLSYSKPFNSTEAPTSVKNAEVMVTDSEGNSFEFEELSGGNYQSKTAFNGEIGRRYHLKIEVDGNTIEASEEMMPVTNIDTLIVSINEEELEDPEDEGTFYEVLFYAKEPQETEDYYYFKFYKNGVFDDDEWSTEVYIFDDIALGENIDALPLPHFYKSGDTATVEMFSVPKSGFIYYSDLYENINSDGGMFSGQPANLRTNLSGEAIGYFQVSALRTKSIAIP